jgi:ATP-dependent DNA helicase PIF1
MDLSILSIEQRLAFEKFRRGENLFVTGPGGSGKTRLIEYFVKHCKQVGKTCQVTAMTGCATTLLPRMCNPRTIHSWSGIKLCKGDRDAIIQGALRKKTTRTTWRKTDVLVVDEVSMMSKKVFEVLDAIAKTARLSTSVFGGMQVVFTGDFLQLPPVPTQGEKDSAKFCFETSLWERVFSFPNNIELRTIFRQRDPVYQDILMEVRKGKLSEKNAAILQKYCRDEKEETDPTALVTRLFPVRYKTEALNQRKYDELTSDEYEYAAVVQSNCKTNLDTGKPLSVEDMLKCEGLSKAEKEYELRNMLTTANYPEKMALKKGCVVMCTTNLDLDNNICNGSQGSIIDFTKVASGSVPVVRFSNGLVRQIEPKFRQSDEYPCLAIAQIPLCLAWGLTIHKIQGATLETAEIDIGSQIFECGQTYVALSRIKSLEGLSLSAFRPENIRANERALAYYKELGTMNYAKELDKLNANPFVEYELKEEENEKEQEACEKRDDGVKCVSLGIVSSLPHPPPGAKKVAKEPTADITWDLYLQKHSLDEIAAIRGLKKNTIKEHFLAKMPDERIRLEDLMPLETYQEIKAAFEEFGNEPLSVIKPHVKYSIGYTDLKLVKYALFGKDDAPPSTIKHIILNSSGGPSC